MEEYYKNPIMESWTYVSMGMDNLKKLDARAYKRITEKQRLRLQETRECLDDIKNRCEELRIDYLEARLHIEHFLQKFPLAIRRNVGWDDFNYIFLYILTRMIEPRIVIETGCNYGFSSTFIGLAVKENGTGGKFYTIEPYTKGYSWEDWILKRRHLKDIDDLKINKSKLQSDSRALCVVPKDIRTHIILKEGFSKDILPRLLEENKPVDIFYHDSDHSYKNVIWECSAVLPYLKEGGYVFVHDVDLSPAFREMFGGEKGGVTLCDNMGVYKKNTSPKNYS